MKNLKIPKKIWKKIQEIKNKQHLNSFPDTIKYILEERQLEIAKSEQKLEDIIEIEKHVSSLSEKQIKEISSNAPFPHTLTFMCLDCAEAFEFSKEDQDKLLGIQCHNCNTFSSIQVMAWLPNLEDENEIKK